MLMRLHRWHSKLLRRVQDYFCELMSCIYVRADLQCTRRYSCDGTHHEEEPITEVGTHLVENECVGKKTKVCILVDIRKLKGMRMRC